MSMSVRRSLAPIPDNNGRPRMSIGGAALRKALPPETPAGPSRQSSSFPSRPSARLSSAFGNAQIAAPMRASMGRPSSGAPLGVANAAPTERVKDPRNIRDRAYMDMSIRTLIRFLTESGYDRPISPKILNAPSARDFQNIFMFLYHQIDPNYEITGKFEEEVPTLIRALRYPFASDIGRSQLMAVGSLHTWPIMLALLVWMVELILLCSQKMEMMREGEEEVFLTYLAKSYEGWMNYNEDESLDAELAASFTRKSEAIEEEIKVLEDNHREMQAELDRVTKDQPPISEMEAKVAASHKTIKALEELIKTLRDKTAKLQQTLKLSGEQVAAIEKELQAAQREKASVEQILATQELNPADVQRILSERESAEEQLAAMQRERDQAQALVDKREMEHSRRMLATEQLLHQYHALAARLTTEAAVSTPSVSPCDCTLSLGKVHQLSVNLKTSVHPWLVRLREAHVARIDELQHERQLAVEAAEAAEEKLAEAVADENALQARLRAVEAQVTAAKDAYHKENATAAAQQEAMERQLLELRQGGGETTTRLQNVILDLRAEQQRLLASDDVDKYGREAIRLLEDLIKHKTHIENSLQELRQQVAIEIRTAAEGAQAN